MREHRWRGRLRATLGLGIALSGACLVCFAFFGLVPASATSTSSVSVGSGATTQVTVPGGSGATTQVTVPGGSGATTQVTVPGATVPAPLGSSTPATVPTSGPLSPPAGSGADSLLSPPPIRHGNPPTFAERYGSSYYSLTQAANPTSTSATAPALGAVTDALWSIVMLAVGFAITVVEWAFHLDLASVIAPALHHITKTLARVVFDPWVATVIVVGGAWLVWWGLVRRRASMAGEGALWMLVALVAGLAFLAQPTALLVGADHATSAIGTSALSALAPIMPDQSSIDGASTASDAYSKGSASDAELRKAANTLWETYVYEPWLVAEFGSTSAGSTAGPAWLALQANGGTVQAEQADLAASRPGTTAAGQPGATGATAGHSPPPSAKVASSASATAQAWFAGSYPSGRFGVVLVAFMAAVALCVALCALALAVLLAQVALVLLVALAPVFLLLGVHPGYGRRIGVRWAELALAAVLKRVVYSVALAAALVIIGSLVALMSSASVGWAITALLPTLAMVALLVFRQRVSQALLGTGAGQILAGRHVQVQRSSRTAAPHAGAPRRIATHPAPTREPAPGARPPWWTATRKPLRSPVPNPRPREPALPGAPRAATSPAGTSPAGTAATGTAATSPADALALPPEPAPVS